MTGVEFWNLLTKVIENWREGKGEEFGFKVLVDNLGWLQVMAATTMDSPEKFWAVVKEMRGRSHSREGESWPEVGVENFSDVESLVARLTQVGQVYRDNGVIGGGRYPRTNLERFNGKFPSWKGRSVLSLHKSEDYPTLCLYGEGYDLSTVEQLEATGLVIFNDTPDAPRFDESLASFSLLPEREVLRAKGIVSSESAREKEDRQLREEAEAGADRLLADLRKSPRVQRVLDNLGKSLRVQRWSAVNVGDHVVLSGPGTTGIGVVREVGKEKFRVTLGATDTGVGLTFFFDQVRGGWFRGGQGSGQWWCSLDPHYQ